MALRGLSLVHGNATIAGLLRAVLAAPICLWLHISGRIIPLLRGRWDSDAAVRHHPGFSCIPHDQPWHHNWVLGMEALTSRLPPALQALQAAAAQMSLTRSTPARPMPSTVPAAQS